MAFVANGFGKSAKLAVAALGMAALALPMASAFATGEDPTQAAPEAVVLTAEQTTAARALFNQYSCGACHALSAAGGSGNIGPALDGNVNLDHDYVVSRVTGGQGQMPGFGGMIAEDQIELLADYILAVKK